MYVIFTNIVHEFGL